jgi:hypothetical protein
MYSEQFRGSEEAGDRAQIGRRGWVEEHAAYLRERVSAVHLLQQTHDREIVAYAAYAPRRGLRADRDLVGCCRPVRDCGKHAEIDSCLQRRRAVKAGYGIDDQVRRDVRHMLLRRFSPGWRASWPSHEER